MNEIIKQIKNKINQKKIITQSIVNSLTNEEINYLANKYNHCNLKCCLLSFKIEFINNTIPVTHCYLCNKELTYRHIKESFDRKQIRKACSLECSKKLGIISLQEKYGENVTNMSKIPGLMEKRKLSNIIKYGVDNVMKVPVIKEKSIINQKRKNDGILSFNKPENRQKALNSLRKYQLKVFKTPHPMLNLEECIRRNKIKDETVMSRYGVQNVFYVDEIKQKANNTLFNNYGVTNAGFLVNNRQKLEIEIFNFIQQKTKHKVLFQVNDLIKFYQLDIYIPELRLAIEVNGDYWHSIKKLGSQQKRQLYKTNLCEKKGIRLIHIWEHEWLNNKEFIKTLLTLYLENKVYQNEFQKLLEQFNNRLPRDYFSVLDFPGEIELPIIEKSGNFDVYKTGYILI